MHRGGGVSDGNEISHNAGCIRRYRATGVTGVSCCRSPKHRSTFASGESSLERGSEHGSNLIARTVGDCHAGGCKDRKSVEDGDRTQRRIDDLKDLVETKPAGETGESSGEVERLGRQAPGDLTGEIAN